MHLHTEPLWNAQHTDPGAEILALALLMLVGLWHILAALRPGWFISCERKKNVSE